MNMLIFAMVLELIGYVILIIFSWKVALGAFLLFWARNISNKYK